LQRLQQTFRVVGIGGVSRWSDAVCSSQHSSAVPLLPQGYVMEPVLIILYTFDLIQLSINIFI